MDVNQIEGIGQELRAFLKEYQDCFVDGRSRRHLTTYMRGQMSDLPRKSIEPIALEFDVPVRTLQAFIALAEWDEQRMRDRAQQQVARDHADAEAIGVIDDSPHPKKGEKTACVQRQWCGRTGKIDNCVVGVHLSYVSGDFRVLLDSELFVPKEWAEDLPRRREAEIPDEVAYRPKTQIALAQLDRALGHGIRVAAWTADAWYGRDGEFHDGLETRGQSYVLEVPANFYGWVKAPRVLLKPLSGERIGGRRKRYPRLAARQPASEVRDLVRYSRVFSSQKWRPFRVRDGEQGPIVMEVKCAAFYRKQEHGLPSREHTLLAVRPVLRPAEIKYFVANMAVMKPGRPPSLSMVAPRSALAAAAASPQGAGTGTPPPRATLEWVLWVAFSRWPIEQCFERAKNELGLDHFEVRGWRSIHRHFYITQLTHLFCSRLHQRWREKNDEVVVPDGRAGAHGGLCVGRRAIAITSGSSAPVPPHPSDDSPLAVA